MIQGLWADTFITQSTYIYSSVPLCIIQWADTFRVIQCLTWVFWAHTYIFQSRHMCYSVSLCVSHTIQSRHMYYSGSLCVSYTHLSTCPYLYLYSHYACTKKNRNSAKVQNSERILYKYLYIYTAEFMQDSAWITEMYGVATISWLLKIVGLFCRRAL